MSQRCRKIKTRLPWPRRRAKRTWRRFARHWNRRPSASACRHRGPMVTLQPLVSNAALARLVARIDALAREELAAGTLSRIDLSVALIDCGIKVCEADAGSRSALARSFVRFAKTLDADALTGAD